MKDQLKYWLPLIIMFIGFVVNGIGWLDSNNKRKADQEIFEFKIETYKKQCDCNTASNEKQDEILGKINIAIGRITGILESKE